MNRPLEDWQKERIGEAIELLHTLEMKVWGMLSPSSERDITRYHLNRAKVNLYRLLKENDDNDN